MLRGVAIVSGHLPVLHHARSVAQADCLTCHGDASMTDSARPQHRSRRHRNSAPAFTAACNAPTATPTSRAIRILTKLRRLIARPATPTRPIQLKGSVHADGKEHPCTSCHGNAHEIFPKTDARSAVYPLNVPKTCGQCHSNNGMAGKHGLPSVYPNYMDSIHGFALSKEGLLVAANCQSCHGSHKILSHTDPQSPTFKSNIPKTCGTCHAKIDADYEYGVHGKGHCRRQSEALRSAPIATPRTPFCSPRNRPSACSPRPSAATATKTSSPPTATPSTRSLARWAAMLKQPAAGTATARTTCCPPSDPNSPVNKANLVTTCGRCHAGANLSFVQYQPHANARDRKLNPGALLCAAVHEPAAGQRAHLLPDSHHLVADPLALQPGQEPRTAMEERMPDLALPAQADVKPMRRPARPSSVIFVRFTREQRYHARGAVHYVSRPRGHRPAHALQRELLGAQVRRRRGRIRRHPLLPQALRAGADHRLSHPRQGILPARPHQSRKRNLLGSRPRWSPTGKT